MLSVALSGSPSHTSISHYDFILASSRADVVLPPGWRWRGPWYLDREKAEADEEASINTVCEEYFENERYYPIRGWSAKVREE